MPKTKLGKVSLSPKGAWDASTTYEQLDMVSYAGGSWLAKKPSTNITPADGEYWMEVAEKGSKGDKGDKGDTGEKGDTGSDADVTNENIAKALGYEPEAPEGNYELIEAIKLTDDVKTVSRTQEPDGTQYAFNGIIIIGVCPAGTTQALFQGNMKTSKGKEETIWSATGSKASTVTYAHSIWEKWHGLWRRGRSTVWYSDDTFVQDAILYVRGLQNKAIEGEYINEIRFSGGAGITFWIYGRRYGGG